MPSCMYTMQSGLWEQIDPTEPITIDTMTDAKLDVKLSCSHAQAVAGEGRQLNDVFDELERTHI